MTSAEGEEVRNLLSEKVSGMERLSWDELDAYGERIENVTLTSGKQISLRTATYWDMEPWESDLHIVAQAGRDREHRLRRGEDLPQ